MPELRAGNKNCHGVFGLENMGSLAVYAATIKLTVEQQKLKGLL